MITRKKFLIILSVAAIIFAGLFLYTKHLANNLLQAYQDRESIIITDRNDEVTKILPNEDNFQNIYLDQIPANFGLAVIAQEDRFFLSHPGVNPISTARSLFKLVLSQERVASSTITQQLTKILLHNESDRTFKNKFKEMIYAISLDIHTDKAEILTMYANSIYFGNQIQGLELASQFYFEKPAQNLNNQEIQELLKTISSPSVYNPLKNTNTKKSFNQDAYFELSTLSLDCANHCQATIDNQLSNKIRSIIYEKILTLSDQNVHHAAVVVIKIPENEILAIVGSPDPLSQLPGDQFNMALETRPIGSTIKPFIYTEGFHKGLRPYTLVDDREYKYQTGAGFAHYPKNYDYQYRGIVTLHESLSNSLNVPTVKTLEFIGLENFYNLLLNNLEFQPIQPLSSYQYGIALGHLEMDLLTLAQYFTIFPQNGWLSSLTVSREAAPPPHPSFKIREEGQQIFAEKYVQLTNKILSDREAASDQFGLVGNLTLPYNNFAVKTGTSREFHDSWTVGYTPDFLVGVWVGNSDNTPMDEISGQVGAGSIWNEVMLLLLNSDYNTEQNFSSKQITNFGTEFGLPEDDFEFHQNIMIDTPLILSPHNLDQFELESSTQIPLRASQEVDWRIYNQNNELIFKTAKTSSAFKPEDSGTYTINATPTTDVWLEEPHAHQEITIFIQQP